MHYHIQVTNPAIDPLREGLVMSLEVNLGKRGNILEVGPENASQVNGLLSHSLYYFLLYNLFSSIILFPKDTMHVVLLTKANT